MDVPPIAFPAFSFLTSLAVTLWLYRQPRKAWFMPALGVLLFVLLGIYAIPGFFAGVGITLLKNNEQNKKQDKKTGTKKLFKQFNAKK